MKAKKQPKSLFRDRDHVFLAVIHVTSNEHQTLHDAEIAYECGADGILLINHIHMPSFNLVHMYEVVRKRNPLYWIGVNFLGMNPFTAVQTLPDDADGLWTDNAEIPCNGGEAKSAERTISAFREKFGDDALYFGGVAFKGQHQPKDLVRATSRARHLMDVVTTSGTATGASPPVKKIEEMSQELNGHPLGIASGMTAGNVQNYKPYAHYFLVNTSISNTEGSLVPEKVVAMERAIHK